MTITIDDVNPHTRFVTLTAGTWTSAGAAVVTDTTRVEAATMRVIAALIEKARAQA